MPFALLLSLALAQADAGTPASFDVQLPEGPTPAPWNDQRASLGAGNRTGASLSVDSTLPWYQRLTIGGYARMGAYFTLPFRDQALLDAVSAGIDLDRAQRVEAERVRRQAERYATLTAREREVLREVTRGRLNKQIGYDLGISEVTVKLHRSSVMRKMQVTSLGELIGAWNLLPCTLRQMAA